MNIDWDKFNADLDTSLSRVTGRNLGASVPTVQQPGNGLYDSNLDNEGADIPGEGPIMGNGSPGRNGQYSDQSIPREQNLGAGPEPTDPNRFQSNLSDTGQNAPQQNLGGQQKPKVPIMPDGFQFKFDEKKLETAKSPTDYVDAMKPTSRNTYLNWYEKQFGSINAQHDNMLQQIGVKPDPDRKLSRKEKWTALMEFGINLIKSSQSRQQGGQGDNLGSALAVAAGNTVAGLDARRQGEVSQFDERRQGVEASRQAQLKNLGSYGDALKSQADIDADEATQGRQNLGAILDIQKANDPDVEVIRSDQGTFAYDKRGGKTTEITDTKGRRLTNLEARGGATQSDYQVKHANLATMYQRRGLAKTREQAEDMATELLNTAKTNATNPVALKTKAAQMASRVLGTSSNWWQVKSQYPGKTYQQALSELTDSTYQELSELAGVATDEQPTGGPKKVSTQAEYDALPSGTKYLAPDGSTRTKK